MIKQNWKNIAHMLGYSDTHCIVIENIMENKEPVDVYMLHKRIGLSRSLISKITKELSEKGILERIRFRHRFVYRLNGNFLYCMYESFIRQLKRNIDEMEDGGLEKQLKRIRDHLSNFRGD
ncbi:MAG: hypothetical protein JHC29_06430 [Thermoplasmata archaeon]|jgi:predicted transcriptional regulator|nr:hypothetical protein [Thermoplasmata archaeon]MVT12666.1 hypothetical protein [Euryarchaeota archaeon]